MGGRGGVLRREGAVRREEVVRRELRGGKGGEMEMRMGLGRVEGERWGSGRRGGGGGGGRRSRWVEDVEVYAGIDESRLFDVYDMIELMI